MSEYETDLTYTFPSEDGREQPTDPNADLIGLTVTYESHTWKITGTPPWSPSGQYICLDSADDPRCVGTCRPAALVRQALTSR